MKCISVNGDVTEVNRYAIQLFIEFNVFDWKVKYHLRQFSESSIYNFICIASWGYYLRVAIIKTVAIN